MIRVVSLFCGLGGADLGLYAAAEALGIDVEVVDAIDSWPKAVEVYNANLPHPIARVADAKKMTRADLRPHDLVIGGAPCQDHSVAGKRACKCNVGGPAVERCCLADFVRLAGDAPYLMENVMPRLINAPWSEKLCAADFGDVTSRKRWFYSTHLLHVVPAPGPRRIRDIRDHDEDERVLRKRGYYPSALVTHRPRTNSDGCEPYDTHVGDTDTFGSLTADAPRASKQERVLCKAGAHEHYGSIAIVERSGDGNDAIVRGPDAYLGSLISGSWNNTNKKAAALKIGLRGHSASASAFEDDSVLGSLNGNAFHANEASRLVACRNPSLLEMARAHSIPDSFDWCGASKEARGQMTANSWPVGMAAAVCKAMLTSLVSERNLVA